MSYLCSPPKKNVQGIQFKLNNDSNIPNDPNNSSLFTPLKRSCKISSPNTTRASLNESTQRELYSFIKDKSQKNQDAQYDSTKKTYRSSLDSSRSQSQTHIHYAQLLHKQQQYQQYQIQQLQQAYSKNSFALPEIPQSQRNQGSKRVLMVKYHDSLNLQPEFMQNQGSMCSTDLWSQRQTKLFYSLHSDYYEDLKLLSLQHKPSNSSVCQGNSSHQVGKNIVTSMSTQNLKDSVQQNSQFLFGKASLRNSKSQEQVKIPGSTSSPSSLPSFSSNTPMKDKYNQQTDEKLVDSGKYLMMEIDRDGVSNFQPEKMKKQAKLILRLQSEKQGIIIPSQNPRQFIDSIIRKGLPLDLLYSKKRKSESQLSLSPVKQALNKQAQQNQSVNKFINQNTDSTFCTDNNLRSRIISAQWNNGTSTITSLPLETTPNSERRVKQLFTKLDQHNPSSSSSQMSLRQIPKLSLQQSDCKIASKKQDNITTKKEENTVITSKKQKLKGQLFPVNFNINDHNFKEFNESESPLLKSFAKKKKQFSIETIKLGEQMTNIISQCNETLNSGVHTIKEVNDILEEKEQLDINLINEKDDLNSSYY